MIKLLALLNLPGLFFLGLYLNNAVSITQDLPNTVDPGGEVRVTVMVDKQQVSGFAKLQIDLPEGFTASAIETKGASFTFSDNKAKFIWMALPAAPNFSVSYTLKAPNKATAPRAVTGRFSYILDNERRTADLPAATLAAARTAAPEHDPLDDVVSASGAAPVSSSMAGASRSGIPLVPPMQGPAKVSASRTIRPVSDTEVLVDVRVDKGSIRGFGKLQESIPAGFTAIPVGSDEAIFTTQDRTVKYVWLNLPAREQLQITYKLRSNSSTNGEFGINGEFGYLLNDETQKAVLGTSLFELGVPAANQEAIAVLPPTAGTAAPATEAQPAVITSGVKPVTTTPSNPTTAQKPATAPTSGTPATASTTKSATSTPAASTAQTPSTPATKQEPASSTATANTTPRASQPVTRIPAPENGLVYKVQISAAHREVDGEYFRKRHRYTGDFSIERHQGWIKYVTGRFDAYPNARRQRDRFVTDGHNFPGPFVTAYNNGERITVQEALMIANQRPAQ